MSGAAEVQPDPLNAAANSNVNFRFSPRIMKALANAQLQSRRCVKSPAHTCALPVQYSRPPVLAQMAPLPARADHATE